MKNPYARKNSRTRAQREQLRRRVVKEFKAGASRGAISAEHEISGAYVSILLRESGIFGWGKHPVRTSKRNEKIVAAHAAGMARAAIAMRFKVSQSQLSNVLRGAGVYHRTRQASANIESAPSHAEALRRAVVEFRRRKLNETSLPTALQRRAGRSVRTRFAISNKVGA